MALFDKWVVTPHTVPFTEGSPDRPFNPSQYLATIPLASAKEIPPQNPSINLTIQIETESTAWMSANYFAISMENKTNPTLNTHVFYFAALDPSLTQHGCLVFNLSMDTVSVFNATSVATKRPFSMISGEVSRSHLHLGDGSGLTSITPPSDVMTTRRQQASDLFPAGSTVSEVFAVVAVSWVYSNDKSQRFALFCGEKTNVAMTVDGRISALIETVNDIADTVEFNYFGEVTVLDAWVVPASWYDILTANGELDRLSSAEGALNLYAIVPTENGRLAMYDEVFSVNLPSDVYNTYAFGNKETSVVLSPAPYSRRLSCNVSAHPSVGLLQVFVSVDGQETEITSSCALSGAWTADANARAVAKTRDAIAYFKSGAEGVVGAVSGGITGAMVGGVPGALAGVGGGLIAGASGIVSTAIDASLRVYQSQRETSNSGLVNCIYQTDGTNPTSFWGIVNVFRVYDKYRTTRTLTYRQYGWDGARPVYSGEVPTVTDTGYFYIQGDVKVEPQKRGYDWLIPYIEDKISRGLRIWGSSAMLDLANGTPMG